MKNEHKHCNDKCDDEECSCGHEHEQGPEKKETQQMYMEFQMLTQQREQLQAQIQNFDSQLMELEGIKENLKEMEEIKDGSELYVPVSAGIFVNATIKNSKKLLVNVGSNTIASKSAEEAVSMLENQAKEISKVKNEMINQTVLNAIKLKKLQQKLLKMIKE